MKFLVLKGQHTQQGQPYSYLVSQELAMKRFELITQGRKNGKLQDILAIVENGSSYATVFVEDIYEFELDITEERYQRYHYSIDRTSKIPTKKVLDIFLGYSADHIPGYYKLTTGDKMYQIVDIINQEENEEQVQEAIYWLAENLNDEYINILIKRLIERKKES